MADQVAEPFRAAVPLIWGGVPQRNRNFIGREDLLTEVHSRSDGTKPTAVLPQAIHGLGGVGKTQLAIEYIYRYASEYQVVWWIPADEVALVRSTLAGLAKRLGITGIAPDRVEDTVAAVLDALRRGEPYDRWLIIFDNADQPNQIREFIPQGPGYVIVTSRNRGWTQIVEAMQVDVFTRDESQRYLSRRVPGINPDGAARLAEELGDLPLALEQAAALLSETGVLTVDVYLRLLSDESDRILGETPAPTDYPVPVAAAWSLSVMRLREQTPHAMELLQRCAFFGPAPISLDLLNRGRHAVGPPLKVTLSDPILMDRAIRALGRYSLAKIDNYRRTIEMHRIIQRLIRNELDSEDRFAMRHEVHLLLAASDPGDPDKKDNWPAYQELLSHFTPAEVVSCRTTEVRRLARNVVRYLYNTGDYASALSSVNRALSAWSEESGEDDELVLVMSRLKAQVLRALGRYEEADDIAERTFEKMRSFLGEDHEETLILMNGRCVDLWAKGDFRGSLPLTKDCLERTQQVFGNDHPRTLVARNNLVEAYELNSRYEAAEELNDEVYQEKREVYLGDNDPTVLYTLAGSGRITRERGHFAEAREIAQRAYDGYQDMIEQHQFPEGHPWVLQQAVDYSAALRAAGYDPEALRIAQDAYDRYQRAVGPRHAATLAAANNLANAIRLAGDLGRAGQLLEETEKNCRALFDDLHPYTLLTSMNLCINMRRQGDAETACGVLTEIHRHLHHSLGAQAHPTLICAVNLANTLADLGKPAEAARIGEEVLPRLKELLGTDHPHTLTCAMNVSLDLRAMGETEQAAAVAADALTRYRATLGDDHPEVLAAEAGERQDLGIEVPVLF